MFIRLRFQREGAERGRILTLEQLYKITLKHIAPDSVSRSLSLRAWHHCIKLSLLWLRLIAPPRHAHNRHCWLLIAFATLSSTPSNSVVQYVLASLNLITHVRTDERWCLQIGFNLLGRRLDNEAENLRINNRYKPCGAFNNERQLLLLAIADITSIENLYQWI